MSRFRSKLSKSIFYNEDYFTTMPSNYRLKQNENSDILLENFVKREEKKEREKWWKRYIEESGNERERDRGKERQREMKTRERESERERE